MQFVCTAVVQGGRGRGCVASLISASSQLDNETPDGEYLMALRALAVRVGLVPPFFTATGNNSVPFGSSEVADPERAATVN